MESINGNKIINERTEKNHYLKTVNPFFSKVWDKIKLFEYRINDRDFQENDIVYLQEFYPENQFFSGAEIKVRITYLLKDFPGLEENHCVFSFEILDRIIMNEDLKGTVL